MPDLHPLVICAIAFWAEDEQLPFDLVCDLIGLGYDVEALERRYA